MADEDNPMSAQELEAWREQQEQRMRRRAMWRAWKHLLLWIGAGAIAIKATADIVKGVWEWLSGH